VARGIAISSPDGNVVQRLRAALHDLEVTADSETSTAALRVLHRSGDAVSIAHEVDNFGVPAIVLVDGLVLDRVVELMGASDRIIGVLDAAAFDAREVSLLAKRTLGLARFGLAPVVASHVAMQTATVRDYDDKLACLAAIRASAEASALPMLQIDAVEQCVDEMMMNALYDAVVDPNGRRVFEGLSTRKRIVRRTDREVTVQYGGASGRFSVAVRDTFGSLKRDVVLRHLHKGLHAEHKVDRKVGGAGLGLFLMAGAASTLSFTIAAGSQTEVRCTFRSDPQPRGQLEVVEIAPEPEGGSARPVRVLRTPAGRRQLADLVALAGAAIVLPLMLLVPPFRRAESRIDIAVQPADARVELDGRVIPQAASGPRTVLVALGHAAHLRAARDGYDTGELTIIGDVKTATASITLLPVATLELETDPPDAAVVIDGEPMGSTPLTLTSLRPETTVAVKLDKPGYGPVTSKMEVPARGRTLHFRQSLSRDRAFMLVHLDSVPPGARVLREGTTPTSDHTYTPADVFVARTRAERFRIEMPGRAPAVVEVEPNASEDTITKRVELAAAVAPAP
jgi:hypothetical protein